MFWYNMGDFKCLSKSILTPLEVRFGASIFAWKGSNWNWPGYLSNHFDCRKYLSNSAYLDDGLCTPWGIRVALVTLWDSDNMTNTIYVSWSDESPAGVLLVVPQWGILLGHGIVYSCLTLECVIHCSLSTSIQISIIVYIRSKDHYEDTVITPCLGYGW